MHWTVKTRSALHNNSSLFVCGVSAEFDQAGLAENRFRMTTYVRKANTTWNHFPPGKEEG
jgi:hypothetical protein